MISIVKIGMKLSTIRERMLSRIVSPTFMAIFARNSNAVLCNMYDSLKKSIYLKYLDFFREQVSAAYEQSHGKFRYWARMRKQ